MFLRKIELKILIISIMLIPALLFFQRAAFAAEIKAGEAARAGVESAGDTAIFLFRKDRAAVAVIALTIAAVVLAFLKLGSGKTARIRKIAGIGAIEEAVGRAAETGRPALFLTGLYDMNSIATLAGVTALAHVARLTAAYDVRLTVPCCHPLVYNAAANVVRDAYSAAGKPEDFSPDSVRFVTEDQWGFAAGVEGVMTRERPAACFYFGHFVSESLIYAETGAAIGAIQIAATNEFTQIPFFVAACDHTLIGEELYAASAYFSKESRETATLSAQDAVKALICAAIIAGVLFETAAPFYPESAKTLGAFRKFFTTEN